MSTPPSDPQGQPSFPNPETNPPGSFPAPSADPAGSYPPPPPVPSGPPQYSPPPPQYAPAPPQYGQPPQYGMPPMPAPGGQMAPTGLYQDADSGLLIPTGTTLASRGRRIGAYFLAIPLSIVTLVIGYIIWGLVAWGKGTTPALQVLGMRVWRPAQRQTATWGTMALREIVGGIVEALVYPIIALVSFIMFLSGRERKALHDTIASTIVLHDPNKVLG